MLNHPDEDPHEKREMDDRYERRHTALGVGGAILALAIIGLGILAWRAYPEFRRHAAALSALPSIQQLVDGMGDRFKDVNAKLEEWASDRQTLNDRMTKLGQRMEARFENMRKQVEEVSAETMRRVQAEIENKMQTLDARLERLESGRNSDQTRVAELQNELNQVRDQLQGELAKQAGELNTVRRDMEDRGAAHERQVASLMEREERDQRNLSDNVASIQQRLAVRRVDFEVNKNHSRDLAEGFLLDVTGTDPLYRKASGWMWVAADRRTIWLKNQAAQEPVVFYGFKDGKKRELVFTNVTKDSVTGYLLLPAEAPATTPPVSTQSDE
jgi:predicted nuclease with TOPRIM domain